MNKQNQNVYLKAAEMFDAWCGKTNINRGSCNVLARITSHQNLTAYQDLFDCHGYNENAFDVKYRKLLKKGPSYRVNIKKVNEIRVLALLFASHALDS